MDNYITVHEAAKLWGVSERQVQQLCHSGKVEGAFHIGRSWVIPKSAQKPADGRIASGNYLNWRK